MDSTASGPAGRRAHALRAQAQHARAVARDLVALADAAETRLAPVEARMGPGVWAGEAARVAGDGVTLARADLAMAASQLREVAHDLRVTAATLEWRASDLLTGEALTAVTP